MTRDEFPQVVDEPAWRPPQLVGSERVDEYLGDRVMRLKRDGAKGGALAVSPTPLVARGGDGQQRPVDVALVETASGFEPRSPLVPSRLPRRLADGIAFPGSSLSVRPAAAAGSVARRAGEGVFYDNVQRDTDFVAQPLPTGAETFYHLRSAESPEFFDVRLEGPGADLALVSRDDGGVEIHRDGAKIGSVTVPLAKDAQDQAVSVRYELRGATLRVHVPHRSRDYAYPILVDPGYVLHYSSSNGFGGWQFGTPWPSHFSGGYCDSHRTDCNHGLNLWSAAGQHFGNLTWGWWLMQTPRLGHGSTYVFRTEWAHLRHVAPPQACITVGIWNSPVGDWERAGDSSDPITGSGAPGPFNNCPGMLDGWPTTCARPGCGWDGMSGSQPAFKQWMFGDGTRHGTDMAWVQEPIVFMRDRDTPTLTTMHWSTGENARGWTRFSTLYGIFRAEDPGLGLMDAWVQSDGVDFEPYGELPWCSGAWDAPCPAAADVSFTMHPQEGIHQVTGWATDILEQGSAPLTKTVKHDASLPDVRLSGRLAELDGRSVADDAKLELHAFDGSAAHPRSGVRYLQIKVDGAHAAWTGDRACPDHSCDAKWDYTFKPSSWEPGPHTIEVFACDWADNCGVVKTIRVTVGAGKVPTLQEGQRTARRLVLRAQRTRGAATGVKFQYRRSNTETWSDVPVAAVRTRRSEPVSAWPATLDGNGSSPTLIWDLPATPGLLSGGAIANGPIQVRGVFAGSPETLTSDVHTYFDQSGMGSADETEDITPVSVDLLTGNAALADSDVEIDAFKTDLAVTRTYNSRDTRVDSHRHLGPGWSLGTESEAAGATFSKIVNMAEVGGPDGGFYAIAKSADGGEAAFEESGESTVYVPQLGLEEFKLQRNVVDGRIASYTMADSGAGQTMVFTPTGVTGEYALARIDQDGTADKVAYSYEPVPAGQGQRLTRILAPVPPGVTCSAALVRGCRALELDYATATGGADFTGRLKRIRLRAWDPQQNQMADIPVAQYEYDTSGRLIAAWDPRISPALKTQYEYDSDSKLVKVTPPGELPWTLSYRKATSDPDGGRLRSVTRAAPAPVGGTAVRTVVYGIPVSGAGAPNDMSAVSLDNAGQQDLPVDASAVFRPDDVPADPPASFAKATVHYLNGDGRAVNTAAPGGRITTTEYDDRGNVTRELTARNRQRALGEATTAERATRAQELSTTRTWEITDAGSRVKKELGPAHHMRLGNGTITKARREVTTTYDEGRPDTDKDHNLPTTVTVGARAAGVLHDTRATKTEYDFAKRLVTATVVDPSGLNLRTATIYDANGLAIEDRLPRAPGGGAASTTKTTRYSAGTSDVAACSNRPEWSGLPCLERPASQPATGSGRPELPSTSTQYNLLNQPLVEQEESASGHRTTTTTYDASGRTTRQVVEASAGHPVPTIESEYSPTTGRLLRTVSADGTTRKAVTRTYDAAGRVSSYQDAHGETTATAYDRLDRPKTVSNSAGSQALDYNTHGALSEINDSDLGRILASYDHDFKLQQQVFQTSGLRVDITHNEAGAPTRRAYTKTTNCASDCLWFESKTVEDAHGQRQSHTTSSSTQGYTYDKAGRLQRVEDAVATERCVVRGYEYDANSNRIASNTWRPLSGCSTTGDGDRVTHDYDGADRLVDSDYQYDAFGRTTTVPARDAGGSELSATYHVNDMVRSLSQHGRELTYSLDPQMRMSERKRTGLPTETMHYADDSDEVSWTSTGVGNARRDIPDVSDELAAVRSVDGTRLQLSNLHGDIVAEVANSATAAKPAQLIEADEFGVPKTSAAAPRVEVVGSRSAAHTTPSSSLVLDVPSDTAAGDILLAEIAADASAVITAPPGWTTVSATAGAGGSSRYAVFWRLATASEPAAHAFGFSAAGKHRGGVKALRNVDRAAPVNAVSAATGTAGAPGVPRVTPTVDDAAISVLVGSDRGDADGGGSVAFPDPLIEDFDTASGATLGDRSAASATQLLVGGAGRQTDVYTTMDQTGLSETAWGAITTALAPAPAPVQPRYRWLGAKQRPTETPAGVILMGVRAYLPGTGRFLQTDPIRGGSANAYDYANQDCINQYDLDGRRPARDPEPALPSCKSYYAPGVNVSVAVQISPKGFVQWGVAANPHVRPAAYHVQVFLNGKRIARKRQGRMPHGSIRPGHYRGGDVLRIQGHVRSLATRKSYFGERTCRIPK